jgi:biotin operon repressor
MMLLIEEWMIIRNLKRNHPDMGTRKIAEFLGRSRGAVRTALASECYRSYSRPGCVLASTGPAIVVLNKETGGAMARRHILMDEIVEGIYRWHKGGSGQTISRVLGMDRKTLRKYLEMARQCGVVRGQPFLDRQGLIHKLNNLRQVTYEAPAMDTLAKFRNDIEQWLKDPSITVKDLWRLLVKERGVTVGYTSVQNYVRAHFPFGTPETTVRITAKPRYVAKRIREEVARIGLNTQVTGEHRRERKEKDAVWMRRLMQGVISLDELVQDLGERIAPEDLKKLYDCALRRPVRYRNRALSLLSLLKGISGNRIAEYLLIDRRSVSQSPARYRAGGVASIISDKGKRPLKEEDPAYVDKVFSILHAPPSSFGFNRTSWRQKDIKKVLEDNHLPLSRQGIRNIINKSGFKYRRAKTVLTSKDPGYREKVEEIKRILANLGPKEKFFSIDEYGPFAVKLQGGRSLVPPETTKIVPQWQKSRGSIILTAALELSTNQITHFYSNKKNTVEMIKLLDILLDTYADEECIYFSWDAASWHASRELYQLVDFINSEECRENRKCPFVRLAPLPACAQFLNVIESVFSGMARAIIHNSDYQSVDECRAAIDRYFAERNDHFKKHPRKAGNKIWGRERVEAIFRDSNNCKDPNYYR